MEQANSRTRVFLYPTCFAFEHKPKMTTHPDTNTQTTPTPCEPDSQPWVKHLQPWQVSPARVHNANSLQPWHPLPVCQLPPSRGSRSDRSAQLDLWCRQILQVESNCTLRWGNKPYTIYTSPPPSFQKWCIVISAIGRQGGFHSLLPNYGRNSALPLLQPVQWALYVNHSEKLIQH